MVLESSNWQPYNLKKLLTKAEFSNEEVGAKNCQPSKQSPVQSQQQKHYEKVYDVVPLSLLLILNIFHTFF